MDPVVDTQEFSRPVLEPSAVGQFIAVDECPQFHKYEFDAEVARQRRKERSWKEAFEPLSLLLAKDGRDFETTVRDRISTVAHSLVDHSHIDDWDHSRSALRNVIENAIELPSDVSPLVVSEARLGLQIEAWPIAGDADLLMCWPTTEGVRIRILEIKAAHETKTYQQIQVAAYTVLCRKFLESLNPDFEWEVEGGVIHRETTIESGSPGGFPSFSLDAREQDIRRLLRSGGTFDDYYRAANDSVTYQLASKCHGCAYKEACFTESVEERSTALLGLSRGEQAKLESHGIDTLEELAGLAYPPQDPRPYEYEELTPADRSTYEAILSEPGIGEQLPEYIQRAQSMVAQLTPEFPHTPKSDRRAPWIVGSGNGNLPADDPPFDTELSYPRQSLIRVYLHVEWDHRRDHLVMLNAYLTATASDRSEPLTITRLIDKLPDDQGTARSVEGDLLCEFLDELGEQLRSLSGDLGHGAEAPFHFYLYGNDEYEALTDALRRHEDRDICQSFHDVFGLRGAISELAVDQPMVSVVQKEIRSRVALPVPNHGLLPAMDYFQPSEDFFPRSEWTYTRSDGRRIDLRDAFRYNLFDFVVPFARTPDGIALYPNSDTPDGYYPSRPRQGSHIPLEYIWATLGKLTDEWLGDLQKESQSYQSITPFKWIDRDEQSTRITREDVAALGERLARCVAHIERGVTYRNPNLSKTPIDLQPVGGFSLGETDIGRACREYLQLEYTSNRSKLLTHYALPVTQRVQRGESIPLVVRSASEDQQGRLQVEGYLLYDQMFDDGDRIAASCRQKGASGATGGSWMVANEITRQGEPVNSPHPQAIERGPGVTIEELDIPNRSIRFSAIAGFTPWDQEFKRTHRDWTTEEAEADDDTVYFGEGQLFVLDPRSDDLTAQRAYNVLQESDSIDFCKLVDRLVQTGGSVPGHASFDPSAVTRFLDDLAEAVVDPPNPAQRAFIEETDARVALLQGPPGTGKTAGALAPSALARIAAYSNQGKRLMGLVTGESNKAVDELLADTATLYEQIVASGEASLGDVRFVRLVNEPPDTPHPDVDYVNYHRDSEAVELLSQLLLPDRATSSAARTTLTDFADQDVTTGVDDAHLLLFTTPARLYGLVRNLEDSSGESLAPEERVRMGTASLFDLLLVDEASMMRLPSFLLSAAFLTESSQILIGGDQRQLPPVQVHDWEEETRRTVQTYAPQLSTLDFFRALRDASIEPVPDACIIAGGVDIPLYQLERTYRCHRTVADFLQRNVYQADQIAYSSEEQSQIRPPASSTEGLNAVLAPGTPLTLIVHSDSQHQQSNPVEAEIGAAITDQITAADATGVVTPHNAQRGLLSTLVSSDIEVDTVERYQGGERDCIIVSATASDPEFLTAEQEFILNPNRLNVAMSRMKRKLIVVASESVFGLVPKDVDIYERAKLWKALYREAGVINMDARWSGRLTEFVPGEATTDMDPSIRVYGISASDAD